MQISWNWIFHIFFFLPIPFLKIFSWLHWDCSWVWFEFLLKSKSTSCYRIVVWNLIFNTFSQFFRFFFFFLPFFLVLKSQWVSSVQELRVFSASVCFFTLLFSISNNSLVWPVDDTRIFIKTLCCVWSCLHWDTSVQKSFETITWKWSLLQWRDLWLFWIEKIHPASTMSTIGFWLTVWTQAKSTVLF